MRTPPVRNDSGFTFAELAFGLLILVIGAAVLINHLTVNYQTTALERDRVFAYTKAQAILSEIQGYVDRGLIDAAVDLDVLDDGIVNKTTMTITTDSVGALVAPDHITSGNFQRNGQWVWSRRITVQPFVGLNNRNVRYVTVRIFRKDREGVDRPLADLSAVINSAGSAFPTTQVFDLYLFAIENIPGWWVFMDSIKPFVESMITDLETRNPGLSFRTHWITKASFGRNQSYRPFTNDANDTYTATPDVYHYSGRMPAGNASTYYYVPDTMKGRINVDGAERNGLSDGATGTNPYPYALADFFNHAMRYPDEYALWGQRVQAIEDREQAIADAIAAGTTPPPELDDMSKEPTLRLFLEDLYSNPSKYKNALLINLHGELLPMPALRNYSDAAKDPLNHAGWRVVTHPEELRTDRTNTAANMVLRMYAYANDPAWTGADRMSEPMVVEIDGMNLTLASNPTRIDPTYSLQMIRGGVPVSGNSNYDTAWTSATPESSAVPSSGEMYYRAEFVPASPNAGHEGNVVPFTRLYLYNTPLVCPPITQNTPTTGSVLGLPNSKRGKLYQIPYIPSPLVAGPTFTGRELFTPGNTQPKNTARWRLTIPQSVFTTASGFVNNSGTPVTMSSDVVLKIRTRIASRLSTGDLTWKGSGQTWPTAVQPDNLSTTYAWWTDSREDVPVTERSQFNGDPRHMPYKDCFNNGDDFPNSYNWYHDNLSDGTETLSGTDYASIDTARLRDRWSAAMTADVPRYYQLLREGLTRSQVVYTTLTGYSYYYMGIGQDIGYDSANGYPNSIPSELRAYGSPGTNGYINTIIGARRYVRASTAGTTYWWSQPWLGELYPDSQYATWYTASGTGVRGNLNPGTGANQFYHQTCRAVYSGSNRLAYGTYFNDFLQRTAANGCTTLFNIGTATSSFHHIGSSGNGTLTTVGAELAANYNMTMPSAAPITRPFGLTWNGSTGEEWAYAPYSTKFTASLFRTYYTHAAGTGSGLVKLVNPAGTDAAYIVVNGISNAVDNGTTFISKFAMLSLVHSFFEAGSTTNTLRIPQPARLEIVSPTDITELNDPSTIDIQYNVAWRRWDGLPYSASGTYAESEGQLEYVLMYSNDGGNTWLYVQDDTAATPGTRPTSSAYIVADAGAGPETYTWSVPQASFPEGSYHLRIDCFRQGAQCHYSYHRTKIFIQR